MMPKLSVLVDRALVRVAPALAARVIRETQVVLPAALRDLLLDTARRPRTGRRHPPLSCAFNAVRKTTAPKSATWDAKSVRLALSASSRVRPAFTDKLGVCGKTASGCRKAAARNSWWRSTKS